MKISITINNLALKTWYNQTLLGILFLGLISIIKKHLKDRNNKNKNLKPKIYHLILKTML